MQHPPLVFGGFSFHHYMQLAASACLTFQNMTTGGQYALHKTAFTLTEHKLNSESFSLLIYN